MSRTFLTNIDLKGNQLYNVILHNAASNSGLSTTNGSFYYDTTASSFQFRQAGAWITYIPSSYTLSDFTAPAANVDLNSKKIVNLATPTADTDAANKKYVDDAVNGLDWKASVKVATTDSLANTFTSGGTVIVTYANNTPGTTPSTLTVAVSGTWTAITIDGQSISVNDRVLIKDQATAPTGHLQNGIYRVTQVGAVGNSTSFIFTRASDADTDADFTGGAAVWVETGSSQADTGWVLTSPDGTPTLGTTVFTFTQFTGAGQITAGAGLAKSGNTINFVGAALSGLTINSDDVAVDASKLWIGTSNVVLANSGAAQALTGISSITGTTANFTLNPASRGSGTGYSNTLKGGAASSGTGGEVVLAGGDGTTGGGAVTIDGGTGSTKGAINIGTSVSTAITIGQASVSTTSIAGTVKIAGLTSNGFVKTGSSDGTLSVDTATYANVASNNAFTGANTFTNATGQTFRTASTQDGIIITGRAGGTSTYAVTLSPTTLTASRAITLPNAAGAVALKVTGSISLTANTAATITHSLNTTAVVVQMFDSSWNLVEMDVQNSSSTQTTVTASATATYNYVIIG